MANIRTDVTGLINKSPATQLLVVLEREPAKHCHGVGPSIFELLSARLRRTLQREELVAGVVEHRQRAGGDVEVGAVQRQPALVFRVGDERKSAQVLDRRLDAFLFQRGQTLAVRGL